MAKIQIKRKGQWVHRESRAFDKRSAAEAWQKKRMKQIDQLDGDLSSLKRKGKSLGDAIDLYLAESMEEMGTTKAQVLRTIKEEYKIAQYDAEDIESADIVHFLKQLHDRPELNSASTVLNYASHLSAVFNVANPAWNIPLNKDAMRDAMAVAKKLGITKKPKSRSRRPSLDELDALLSLFEAKYRNRPRSIPMHKVVGFALFSTRRLEEITRITWDGLDTDHSRVFITDMKHPGDKIGNDVWCDLPVQAMEITLSMPQDGERVFPYNKNSIGTAFTRACQLLEIEDLRFHDLRHEGISRLFETGKSIPQVAAVSGHRSWSSLQRYTHIRQTGDKYSDWDWLDRLRN